jgi:RimJ/RimL family protein N-acetyltransferase
VIGAALVTDVNNVVWVTYTDQALTGMVVLTRIQPRVDALLHFMFLDKDLVSKRTLLKNLIAHCFRDLGFNRLSMEVPEGVRLERFARKVLGFRLEGESRPRNPELPKALTDNWVARQGSRREGAYFDGTDWKDVLLLRLLAREWVGEGTECRSEPEQEPQPPPLSEPVGGLFGGGGPSNAQPALPKDLQPLRQQNIGLLQYLLGFNQPGMPWSQPTQPQYGGGPYQGGQTPETQGRAPGPQNPIQRTFGAPGTLPRSPVRPAPTRGPGRTHAARRDAGDVVSGWHAVAPGRTPTPVLQEAPSARCQGRDERLR